MLLLAEGEVMAGKLASGGFQVTIGLLSLYPGLRLLRIQSCQYENTTIIIQPISCKQ